MCFCIYILASSASTSTSYICIYTCTSTSIYIYICIYFYISHLANFSQKTFLKFIELTTFSFMWPGSAVSTCSKLTRY